MAKTIRITWKDGSRYVVSEPNWDGGLVVELAECERMVREAVHRAMLAGWSRSDGPISREYVERIVRKVMRDEE